jgi:hypothetical protein
MNMEEIRDIRIIGIDTLRPPKLQKIPCIELVFKLTHKAPKQWCEAFNVLMGKQPYSVKIDPEIGLFIETWVRKPAEIEKTLAALKKGVTTCSGEYIAALEAKAKARVGQTTSRGGGPSEEQLQLDAVVAELKFDD